ncbi:hypothetical protein SH203_02867 [Brevundimonas sp. SH203]|uniref:hypothetical protein n=1 Tax=Brevundimonas sp. SH203 TaxID=345167 RepID=UPI0009CDA2D5|nr:hypothetical protein [Brevundimonas sp. SH203]GAW42451.1 hypothetical protein SH203_02867 [Brevundimonas sp. SH203]
MTYQVPADVADSVISAARDGRIIQGAWRRKSAGKDMVCALAAFGTDINSPADCPADYMPRWLAELIPGLDDGIAADRVVDFTIGLAERSARWKVLDAAAWDRVRTGFLIHCVEAAVAAAEKSQPEPRRAYWDQVHDACGMVVSALRSGDAKALSTAAEAAARAAAEAAEAAEARAAWAAAAWAAAEAAEAARAAAAARAARAAWAAAAAAEAAEARWSQVETLFALLDAEIAQATSLA